MKKINYIIGFTISFLVLYQPISQNINNYFLEKNRLEEEGFINEFINENKVNYKKLKAEVSKSKRPDLRGVREYLMTYDLSSKIVPKERLLNAINVAESRKYSKRLTEVDWEERGPNNIGGRTRALLVDPNNSNKLWAAGVSGGLWYNTDITSSNEDWNLVDGTWSSLAVSSIAHDPNDTSTMYVGTGERMGNYSSGGSNWYSPGVSKGLGMWKSTDGGATWNHLSSTTDFSYISDIVVRNESGSSTIYIGVGGNEYEGSYHGRDSSGLWKSTDGGTTWSRALNEQETTGYVEIGDLDIGPDNRLWAGSRMNAYWAGGGQIFYSDDGVNWTEANWKSSLGGTPNRALVAVAPSDANTVYILVSDNEGNVARWFAKSSDGGANWTEYTVPTDANGNPLGDGNGQAGYDLSLGVSTTNANVVFAGEIDVFKTTDGGANWTQTTNSGGSQYPYMHVDQHNIKSINGTNYIFSNDGGVYYTNDGAATVSSRNDGYNVGQFYSVAIHPDTGNNYVLGGTQDNGSWRINNSTTSGPSNGSGVTGGDGGFAHIDQTNSSLQFTSIYYNTIYRSTDGGQSFSIWANHTDTNGNDTGLFINPSTIDSGTKTFYSSIDGSSILRIVDYTTLGTKSVMSISLGSTASAFKPSPYTDDVLFVGTSSGRMFKIENASTSSYSVTDITGSNVSGYISSIDIGSNDNQILVTVSNYGATSVFETYGGGGANGWSDIEGDLPDMPVRWGLFNRDNFNQVILATDVGTWVSDDVSVSNPTWNPSNDGLDNVRVDMLAMRSDGAIAAGTHGRGIFYSSAGFSSTAPLNAAFSVDKTSGVFPLTVQFSDRSTGSPTSWTWDFGDGTTSSQANPSHEYTDSGKYSVSLTVGDGTNTDVITKSDVVWVTAQQDIIWEEQFETNPYGWSDGRRDIHEFITVNANNDADEWSWWYYTAGFGAHGWGATGSHWMAGLGMGDGGNGADDWLISPELWLRPGTDNILSFWTDTYDANYVEEYDVLLSPTGGTALSDFTVTLASVEDASTEWTQQTYDLTQWAGSNVRVAIHITTSNQYYAFFDSWRLTAGELSTDGAPLAPSGLTAEPELVYDATSGVWTASSDGIAVFWNRNGESDLASYNVYASQTDDFSPGSGNLLGQGTLGDINVTHFEPSPSDTPWPDSTFVTIQTFGADSLLHDGLTQGEKWYYKVGAVDNDGNETISSQVSYILDSTGPTAGTYTINDLHESEYLRSTSDIVISVDGWSDNVGIAYYYMGIGTTDQDLEADVVFYQNVGLTNLTLTNLTLDDYTKYYLKVAAFDESGNNSDAVISGFTTYTAMLGDYDNDWDVDVEDLNSLVNAWPNVDIGPATGTSPYLTPTLDGSADIYDISAFTRNWQWTKAQGRTLEPQEDIELNPIDFPAELSGNQIKITLPDNITAGRFEIVNNENVYQFSLDNVSEGIILLENEDNINQLYELEFGRLSKDQKELYIYIDGDVATSTLQMNYQLFSKDGMAGNGTMQLGNPDAFKLYQNYPNPFNNQTTIKYDIPSLMVNVVPVEIYIYNTVGKLVRTIDEGDKSVGQHTVIWDGKNDDGENVSSGVYFYQLRTKVDGQSDYNKTMKMVLVR